MVKLRRINEAKQVGILYHVCTSYSLLYNLKNNCIRPGSLSKTRRGKEVISFTRNKNYIVDTLPIGTQYFFQLIIDGDALSDSHKIEPYADRMYRRPTEREQEEIVFGSVENLKKVLKGVTVFIVTSEISLSFSHFDYSVEKDVIEALEELQKFGVPVEIRVVKDISSLSKERTELPSDLPSLIELLKRVYEYDSNRMFSTIIIICERFFKDIGEIKIQALTREIEVAFDESTLLSSCKKELQVLIDTIQEELKSTNIMVTQTKATDKPLSRHSSTKLSSVLNNRSYSISSLVINPCFDYVNLTKPYITLSLLNSSNKPLVFTAQLY